MSSLGSVTQNLYKSVYYGSQNTFKQASKLLSIASTPITQFWNTTWRRQAVVTALTASVVAYTFPATITAGALGSCALSAFAATYALLGATEPLKLMIPAHLFKDPGFNGVPAPFNSALQRSVEPNALFRFDPNVILGQHTEQARFPKQEKSENNEIIAALNACTRELHKIPEALSHYLTEGKLFGSTNKRDVLKELKCGVAKDGWSWIHEDQGTANAKRLAAHNLQILLRKAELAVEDLYNNGCVASHGRVEEHIRTLLEGGLSEDFVSKENQDNMRKLLALIEIHKVARHRAGECSANIDTISEGLGFSNPEKGTVQHVIPELLKLLSSEKAVTKIDEHTKLEGLDVSTDYLVKIHNKPCFIPFNSDGDRNVRTANGTYELVAFVYKDNGESVVRTLSNNVRGTWFKSSSLWHTTEGDKVPLDKVLKEYTSQEFKHLTGQSLNGKIHALSHVEACIYRKI